MAELIIRDERPEDYVRIHEIVRLAFLGREYAGGDEPEVVARLRAQDALSVSLVAEQDGVVVGHIALSPVRAADGSSPWFALGPVAVVPAEQGGRIGARLIKQGLAALREQGALGCMLTGNPAYYQRFGFILSPHNCPPHEPAAYFQLLCFDGAQAEGPLYFHPAFYG